MKTTTLLLFCLVSFASRAQPSPSAQKSLITPKGIIVCYAGEKSMNTHIPEPETYRLWKNAGGRVQQTAAFEVEYNGFSAPAKKAFQKAVDIWSTLITTNVTIKIKATWQELETGVLGSCSPYDVKANFPGAQLQDVWYPISLANKMADIDLNGNDPEIVAHFSSSVSWNYDPDKPSSKGSNKYDLVSVVLHEIGHGLGIFSMYEVTDEGKGQTRSNSSPGIYDLYLQTGSNKKPLIGYESPSSELKSVLTGNSLFFSSPSVLRLNTKEGQVYAPSKYSAGSSIAHNDEDSYPAGDKNSLMTPSIGKDEGMHDPGPITMGELSDMGWTNPILTHTPVANMESTKTDIPVTCTIVGGDADYAPTTSTLQLNYSVDEGKLVTVSMTATGKANEFGTSIPKPTSSQGGIVKYAYYISVKDSKNRGFSWPGKTCKIGTTESSQTYYKFTVGGVDTKGPLVYHTPITVVKNTAPTLELTAKFSDSYGVQGGVVDWLVNTTAQTPVNFTYVSDSTYKATLPLGGTLSRGDIIKYRITATDKAAAHNATSKPSASEYYTVNVMAYGPVKESYCNNFDDLKADNFLGDFTIIKADGFDNGAIHSTHPYSDAQSEKKESINFTYELLTPIKVKEGMGSIKFDEVVLVEPAKKDAAFGNEDFYDYVIVEGSTDGGQNWKPVADGWNSRDKTDWLTTWNSASSGKNSTAKGKSTLFHKRSLSLLDKFKPNDEVILRFRLYSDSQAYGWGWAIDNLEIQGPDLILHNHVDYMMDNAKENVVLSVNAVDVNTLKTLAIDYGDKDNEKKMDTKTFGVDPKNNKYDLTLTTSEAKLQKGNYLDYRIRATNSGCNSSSLPSTGYFRIYVLDLKNPATAFDYTGKYLEFVGNFISETGTTEAISVETDHPYATGFGLNYQSNFCAILYTPIKVSGINPFFAFDEELDLGTGDYAIVEGSKDGITWETLINQYTVGSKGTHTGSFLDGGKFKDGDVVLLRFRLLSDKTNNGWGWKISNLQIQASIHTAINTTAEKFALFPNPVKQGEVTVLAGESKNDRTAEMTDIYGRHLMTKTFAAGSKEIKLPTDNLSAGVYLVTIIEVEKRRTIRFVKL